MNPAFWQTTLSFPEETFCKSTCFEVSNGFRLITSNTGFTIMRFNFYFRTMKYPISALCVVLFGLLAPFRLFNANPVPMPGTIGTIGLAEYGTFNLRQFIFRQKLPNMFQMSLKQLMIWYFFTKEINKALNCSLNLK